MAAKSAGKDVFLEYLGLRRMRWGKYLWDRFRKLPGVEKTYRSTYAGTRSLGDMIWEDVSRGNIARAQLQYAKFMTYLTQYAYGGAEAAPVFRGSLNRLAFMYMSWPINYAEFLTSMANNRCVREWLRLASFWLTFGSLVAGAGTKVYQLFLAVPFRTDLQLKSPILRSAQSAYRIANTVGRASQGWIVGAEDDYYLQNAPDRVVDALEEFEWLIPGRRAYKLFAGD